MENIANSIALEAEQSLYKDGFAAFRGLSLDDGDLRSISKELGELSVPIDNVAEDIESLIDVVRVPFGQRGYSSAAGNIKFHQEDSCCRIPPHLIGIYCEEAKGAALSLVDATLSEDEKSKLEGLKLTHSTKYYESYHGPLISNEHLAVWNSKTSGASSLFANKLFTEELVEESCEVLNETYFRIITQASKMVWDWNAGDLVVFDNIRFLHCGNRLNVNQSKTLRKVHINL